MSIRISPRSVSRPQARQKPLRLYTLASELTAERCDRLWLTDITEHPTGEGKLYLCAIKDFFSNRIVGCSIADRQSSEFAVAALRKAIQRRNPTGTVVNSDRGSHFRSRRSQAELDRHGLVG